MKLLTLFTLALAFHAELHSACYEPGHAHKMFATYAFFQCKSDATKFPNAENLTSITKECMEEAKHANADGLLIMIPSRFAEKLAVTDNPKAEIQRIAQRCAFAARACQEHNLEAMICVCGLEDAPQNKAQPLWAKGKDAQSPLLQGIAQACRNLVSGYILHNEPNFNHGIDNNHYKEACLALKRQIHKIDPKPVIFVKIYPAQLKELSHLFGNELSLAQKFLPSSCVWPGSVYSPNNIPSEKRSLSKNAVEEALRGYPENTLFICGHNREKFPQRDLFFRTVIPAIMHKKCAVALHSLNGPQAAVDFDVDDLRLIKGAFSLCSQL